MAKQPKIRVSKNCNNPLPEKATVCPSCRTKNKKPIYKKWWFWLIVALIVIGAASSGGTESDSSNNQLSFSVSSGETENASSSKSSETDSIPKEYKSALKKAESYSDIDIMHMSKAAIYEQLVSEYGEKFTPEEAQYAIDNVEADWKANALAKAESYQEMMSMSPSAIYEQLVVEYGEKFTTEEAQYAIDNLS